MWGGLVISARRNPEIERIKKKYYLGLIYFCLSIVDQRDGDKKRVVCLIESCIRLPHPQIPNQILLSVKRQRSPATRNDSSS